MTATVKLTLKPLNVPNFVTVQLKAGTEGWMPLPAPPRAAIAAMGHTPPSGEERLRETLRLIDATNKSSAPGARLQRIADYARSALQGIGGRDAGPGAAIDEGTIAARFDEYPVEPPARR